MPLPSFWSRPSGFYLPAAIIDCMVVAPSNETGDGMAAQAQYEELVRQFSAFGAVKREMRRLTSAECPSGSAAVLALLGRHGDMHISRMAELLAVDMSVPSRHVAQAADRGWLQRLPDPADRRSRILRLTPAGRERLGELFRHAPRLLARLPPRPAAADAALLPRLRTDHPYTRKRISRRTSMATTTPSGVRAHAKHGGGSSESQAPMTHRQIMEALSGLLLGMFAAILSSTSVTNALPEIVADLGGGQSAYTWVVTASLLAMTASTPLWGKLADLISKKALVQIAL